MRTPVALSVASSLVFLAHFASAETPAGASTAKGAAASPSAAPAPAAAAPAPAAAAPAPAATPQPAVDDSGPVVVPAESDQPILEPIPSAHDTLGGHFVVGAAIGGKWQFGHLDQDRKLNDYLGAALALNLDIGYGVTRNIVLGVWGEFDKHGEPSGCRSCSGTSIGGGPFIRYHLVQGTRFDPWGAFALGVRSTSSKADSGDKDYFGVDILKLSLGGDWYPTSNFGIGPYVTFDWGTYGKSGGHTGLGTGLRLTLDLPGK